MPKLAEKDQEMFNYLLKCQRDCIEMANIARFHNDHKRANWFLKETERCSSEMDEILAKYHDEPKITTEYINGTIATGTKAYQEKWRNLLTERTVKIDVTVVVRNGR